MVQGGTIIHGYVIDLVHGVRIYSGSGQQVDLDGVVDIAEVPTCFAITVDVHDFVLDHAGDPFGYHGCISAFRILAFAEYVEVAQADGVEAVATGEHISIKFVDVFGNRIGRQRFADAVLHFRQTGMVTVGRAGSGINEALDFGIPSGD